MEMEARCNPTILGLVGACEEDLAENLAEGFPFGDGSEMQSDDSLLLLDA